MPEIRPIERERRRPGARGTLATLADGHPWLLAEPTFRPTAKGLTTPDVDSAIVLAVACLLVAAATLGPDWDFLRVGPLPRIIGWAAGVSYGGATTVALAARNPPGLVAAINFSGGSGGDKDRRPRDPCNPENVADTYAGYGRTTRVPELWLYAENDLLWGAEIPKAWFARFREGGPPATFVETEAVGDNGHALMMRGMRLWRHDVERFLDERATAAH